MPAVTNLETVQIDVESVHPHHKNPRRGDIDAIAKSLTTNGQYRAIVVNKGTHTGRPYEVLAGNHTLLAARKIGLDTIAAHIIDVDEEQATRIVLADNRTADLGDYDLHELEDLANSLPDLEGTGYTTETLDEILNAATTADTLPEPGDADIDDIGMSWDIVITCDNENQQAKLLARFQEEGIPCRAIM
ncbi:ParB/RepB/Spo0J family partition protein [Actinomyces urogenitalis]|uniref:ParB/RepB/Spo0J family partition protein n=1 Tax=Actinomyces urogenitalis TaxID=103621 RepID=UPI00189856E5|nr:ParB N-terminal domain-containing protein [Actinomyces urogenitalis]